MSPNGILQSNNRIPMLHKGAPGLDAIIQGCREYRFLLQARIALQNRLRALLWSLHAASGDQQGSDPQCYTVANAACKDVDSVSVVAGNHHAGANQSAHVPSTMDTHPHQSSVVAGNHHGGGTQDYPVLHTTDNGIPVSQAEDHHALATQAPCVPAWLRKPPPGVSKDMYDPAYLLAMSPAAQVLLWHVTEMEPSLKQRRKLLDAAARTLPIWTEWAAHIRGIDAYGLARVIGEAGDLWHYPSIPKLWKRLSVGLWEGERQQRKVGITQEQALAIGYVPRRRAVIYNMQVGLINQNKDDAGNPGVYRQLYLDRKLYEQVTSPDLPKLAWHMRAGRYMAKRFLRDLRRAWRTCMPRPAGMGQRDHQSDATQGDSVSRHRHWSR